MGAVPWGTHICQLFDTKEDLIDILVPYFKAGLENNELCFWLTSGPLNEEEAKDALHKSAENLDDYIGRGQLEIASAEDWYLKGDGFNTEELLQGWVDKESDAIKKGFDGLRVSGNIDWQYCAYWNNVVDYESIIDTFICKRRMIALCTYPVNDRAISDVVDIVSNHPLVLIRKSGHWELVANHKLKAVFSLKRKGMTYAEIARMFGTTREWVRQIINKRTALSPGTARHSADSLLTIGEAARMLNVHTNTLREWGKKGFIDTYRVGQRKDRRFRLQDVLAFMQRGQGRSCG